MLIRPIDNIELKEKDVEAPNILKRYLPQKVRILLIEEFV